MSAPSLGAWDATSLPVMTLPAADAFTLPDLPEGHGAWREVGPAEHLRAHKAGQPTAYVEWGVDSGTWVTHHFVADAVVVPA